MTAHKDPRLDTEILAAYLEGELPPSEALAIEQALRDQPGAQRRLEQLRRVQGALSAPVPEVDRLDLTDRVRAALESPAAAPQRSRRAGLYALGAGLAAAACVVLFFTFGVAPHEAPEFRSRSAGGATPEHQRWAGVTLRRVGPDGALSELPEAMPSGAALVVSYTNVGPRPFGYLMVFAIDAANEVRWLYPAYERPDSDPSSVAIAPRADVSFGEEVEHDYAPGLATFHALFTQRPWRVSEVETWVKAHRGKFEEAAVGDGHLETRHVSITP